ncbi:hypothetical protein GC175_06495 [bacterium]|nr:hypothetical protein [bacterium]
MKQYRFHLLPILLLMFLAACSRSQPERPPLSIENQGQICFRAQGEDSALQVSIGANENVCLSSSCTKSLERQGTLLIDQEHFLFKGTSFFVVQDISRPNAPCSADCGGAGGVNFEINEPKPGTYAVYLDEQYYGVVSLPLSGLSSVCLQHPISEVAEATPEPTGISPLPTQSFPSEFNDTPKSPVPTPTLVNSATSIAVAFPTITPAPWLVDLVSAPECIADGDKIRCIDTLLHISFEYPSTWGEITSTLRQGLVGYEYAYDFIEPGSTQRTSAIAGGLSRNYELPRGGSILDFRGFSETSAEEYCQSDHQEFCSVVKPGIVLSINFPDDMTICGDFGPGFYSYPLGSVLVDLPIPRLINGFVFHSHILSDEQKVDLYSLLGKIEEAEDYPFPLRPPSDCSPEARAAFNAKRLEMIEDFKSGTMDVSTQANIQALYDLAQSITGPALNGSEE